MVEKVWILMEQSGMDAESHPIGSSDDEDYVRDTLVALQSENRANNYKVVCIPHVDTKEI